MKLSDNVDVEKINWRFFAKNPNLQHFNHHTMRVLADKMKGKKPAIPERCASKRHLEDWEWANPFIFEYDYKAMKSSMYDSGICEELMKNRFHPKNVHKFEDWGYESIF